MIIVDKRYVNAPVRAINAISLTDFINVWISDARYRREWDDSRKCETLNQCGSRNAEISKYLIEIAHLSARKER